MTKIIRLLYLLLVFLTPLIFTSSNSELFELPKMYFVYSITIGIVCLHFINFLKGQTRLFPRFYLTIPLIIYLTTQLLSTIFSSDLHTSIFGYYSRLNGGFLSTLSFFLLSTILINYLEPIFINRIITTSLISGFIVASYGIAQAFGIDKHLWVQDVQNRVFSTLGQPNWLAAYLGILLPLSLYRVFSSKTTLIHTLYSVLFTLFYLCLLFTKSKSGLAAGAITISLYFFLVLLKSKKHLAKTAIIGLSVLILSLTINNPIKDRLFPVSSPPSSRGATGGLNVTPSEDIRKIVWTGALQLWKQFPVFGTGPETFGYSYYWVRPASHNLTSEWDFIYNKAHNEYLNYLATTGTVGFVGYLLIIIVFFVKFFSRYRALQLSSDQPPLLLCIAVFASFVSILITNLAGFTVTAISLFFFLLPGFLDSMPITTPRPAPKSGPLISLFVILVFLSLLSQTFFYYLADITYAQALSLDNNRQYQPAFNQINTSLSYRSNEPTYLIKSATLASKLAVGYQSDPDPAQTEKYTRIAIQNSQKAVTVSPFNLNLWKERAQIYYYLATIDTKYYSSALQSLEAAAKLAPTDAKTFYLLGQFYQNTTDVDSTLKYYQQAITLKSNYDHAYFALGQIYLEQKNYSQAKDMFEKVLTIAPANTDAQNYLNQIAKIKIK